MTYKEKFQESVYTRWEHASLVCCQFLAQRERFHRIAQGMINYKFFGSQRSNVASEFNSLLQEPGLATIVCFLHGFHALFWKLHFDWLKIIDPASKLSGHASREMSTCSFIIHQKINKLEISSSIEDKFFCQSKRTAQ